MWFTPNLILPSDPTALVLPLQSLGTGDRHMFDRRCPDLWRKRKVRGAHLYSAVFGRREPRVVEVQVNPEFSAEAAEAEAVKYCTAIGRLPGFLLRDVQSVWIHRGNEGFGGGNNNLLVHSDRGEEYIRDCVLEEAFVHEATHTSLDQEFLCSAEWRAAMQADRGAISEYARDFPEREDLAESVGPCLASSLLHGRWKRVDPAAVANARRCIPNRIAFLDRLCRDRGWTMAAQP